MRTHRNTHYWSQFEPIIGQTCNYTIIHAIVIKLSKRPDVMDDLTVDLIKSTLGLLWLRSHEADVTGKVKK